MDGVANRFDDYEEIFAKLKYANAVKFLKHFRSGSGARIDFTRKEARNFGPIRKAETRNRENFESITFLGETDDPKINEDLQGLLDGKKVKISDKFNYDQGFGRSLLTSMSAGSDFYFAFGRTKIVSEATFTATRKGDVIHIVGTVTHTWDDKYDFDQFQPEGPGALALQKHRGAKPFKFGAEWSQEFSGTINISNRVLSNPNIIWRDIESRNAK